MKAAVLHLLNCIKGEDVTREGLIETPERVSKAIMSCTAGYLSDPKKHLEKTFEVDDADRGIVVVRDLYFYSLCEHHLLPFFGNISIAYIPKGRVVGLSKFGRLVEGYARRLQVQERLTNQIHDAIVEALNPIGCAVFVEARHLCMEMRGIQKHGATTRTQRISGAFMDNAAARQEMLHLVG